MAYVWYSARPTKVRMLNELAVWWLTGDGQADPEEAIDYLRQLSPNELADWLLEDLGDDVVPHMVEYGWDHCDLVAAFDRLKRSWLTEYKHASSFR